MFLAKSFQPIFFISLQVQLKAQSCKLHNKYMIDLTQITITQTFALIAILVCKFFSRKVLFINRKDKRNW